MRDWIFCIMAATYISDMLPGIFSRIAASRFSSMASGMSSSLNLARRNLIISSLVRPKYMLVTSPARRVVISGRIWCLPVMNIRVPGEFPRISFQESKSLNHCTAVHSSSASMTINMRCADVINCSILTISPSCGLRPLNDFFCSCKACDISSGTLSIPSRVLE